MFLLLACLEPAARQYAMEALDQGWALKNGQQESELSVLTVS